jgi:hypothetical protein
MKDFATKEAIAIDRLSVCPGNNRSVNQLWTYGDTPGRVRHAFYVACRPSDREASRLDALGLLLHAIIDPAVVLASRARLGPDKCAVRKGDRWRAGCSP